jgi:hypothetical protein
MFVAGVTLFTVASGLCGRAVRSPFSFVRRAAACLGVFVRLRVSAEQRPSERDGWLRSFSAGARELRREPAAAVLLGTFVTKYVVVGLLDILLVVLALDGLDTEESGPGLLGGR